MEQPTTHTIDAQGRRLGVVASEAARLLLAKDSPLFSKNTAADVRVEIVNARLMDVSERKRMQEVYKRYSGYPGGQTVETLGHLADRRGYEEALRRSIGGMLPKNKLRSVRMKNLTISA